MFVGATVTGLPALLIILVVLALLVVGFFVVVRGVGRGVGKAARSVEHRNDHQQ